MNKLLASTAVCLILGTAAFAQSPNSSTKDTSSQPQSSSRDRDKDPATQRAPDRAQDRPSGSTRNESSQNQSSQNQPGQNQSSQNQSSQNQSSGSAKDQPSGTAQNQTPPTSNTNQSAAPERSSAPSQAQGNPPAQSGSSSQPSQAQTGSPPAANNQAQQRPGDTNSNTAQQPASNQGNTAQSRQTNVNASVNLNDQQRSRVSQSFARLNVQPLRSVNFSVSVGTVVPRDIHLQTVPADIVEIVPQYRGYSFFAVRDEIVIVDPATYKIVTVLPRSGGSAAAPAHRKLTFTDKDRDVVRKHVRSSERRTTGSSAARVEIRRGERVPDTVEIEEFPETVYREVPALRDYRYIYRDNRTYVVEPNERTIIEEID